MNNFNVFNVKNVKSSALIIIKGIELSQVSWNKSWLTLDSVFQIKILK